ncbi:hypothetical protein K1T71_001210 [Dendrolimus kikuchii]|uniref:Uncharacterized protein n=1 Tax=Dendrolimus kikuchii TaxID=765133 RepID=A0ACC1DHK4_9NEOP|nr:hypothetical protein K1T71_001210 [Dendrolimus kikuchii]
MSAIKWLPSTDGLLPSTPPSNMFSNFIDTLGICNLSQFNSISNRHGKILDLILSNDSLFLSSCPDPLVPEDFHHPSLVFHFDFTMTDKLTTLSRIVYQYAKGNYDAIRSALSNTDWSSLLHDGNVDEVVGKFYTLLYQIRDAHIPQRRKKDYKFPPWYNTALIKLIKEKHKFFTKHKIYGNLCDLATFQLLRERVTEVEKCCYNSYIAKIESSINTNPKVFWSYIKSKRVSNNFPSTMSYIDSTRDSGQGICELFSSYFKSTFLDPSHSNNSMFHPNLSSYPTSSCDIRSIEIDPATVRKHLKSLDLNKSAGPDQLPALFIVKCADQLTFPITLLFQRSMCEGVVPSIWKSAFISPIHKKGPKDKVENYRPISKLCLIAKVFERIVYNQLYNTLHLSQAVVLSGFSSSWVEIPSGVPQGSLLGPLLFVIFINDINTCIHHSKYQLFADDMKIYKSITSPVDASLLQEDIWRISDYCKHNHLDLNISKCSVITFTLFTCLKCNKFIFIFHL